MNRVEVTRETTSWIHGGEKAKADDGNATYRQFMGESITDVDDRLFPFHAFDALEVKREETATEVQDENCYTEMPPDPVYPYFSGVENKTVKQGNAFDPKEGVKAFDGNGNEITFTVSPKELDACEVGEQVFTYTAKADGETTTHERTITVEKVANPTIDGLTELTVEEGEEFDPLDGVTATDGNGNEIEVTAVDGGKDESNLLLDQTNVSIPVSGDYADANDFTLLGTVSNGETIQVTLKGVKMEMDGYGTKAADVIVKSGMVRNNIWLAYIQEMETSADWNGIELIMVIDGNQAGIVCWHENELMQPPTSFSVEELIIERA